MLRPTHPGITHRLLVGLTAGAAALLALWLLHQAEPRAPYPPYSFGDWSIRNTPGDLATWAIEEMGKWARQSIVVGVSLAVLVGSALSALLHRYAPAAFVAAFTALGAWLQPIEPSSTLSVVAVATAAVAALLVTLLDATPVRRENPEARPAATGRRILVLGGLSAGMLALAVMAGVERATRTTRDGAVRIVQRFTSRPDPAFDALPDLSPLVTAPEDHYLIDINLQRPVVDGGSWRLFIHGEVGDERHVTFDEIAALGAVERPIHLQCISNNIGGDLAGTALWAVLPLMDVLALAKPREGARTIVVQAYDGYHESYELGQAADILVAIAMGGLEIPDSHGYPIRLLYPGHYGMRSVKWVTSLELTTGTRADDHGYWQERGWDDVAPLRVGSRIDTPRSGAQPSREVVVAGVAWGPSPVTKVELSADDGETWPYAAELEDPGDEASWVRWKAALNLETGSYDVRARAYCGDEVQGGEYEYPHPRGASGYDLRIVKVG